MPHRLRLILASCYIVAAGGALAQPELPPGLARQLPPQSEVLDVKTKTINGQEYTFVKYRDGTGETQGKAFGAGGRAVSDEQLPRPEKRLLDPALEQAIAAAGNAGDRIKVNVVLNTVDLAIDEDLPDTSGEVEVIGPPGQSKVTVTKNGQPSSEAEVAAEALEHQRARLERLETRKEAIRERLRALSSRHGLTGRFGLQEALDEGRDVVTVELNRGEINALLRQSGDLIDGIELFVEPQTDDTSPPPDVQPAMQKTNIDPYALNYSGRRGNGIGIYVTEGGCPNAGHISRYTRLSGTTNDHVENVTGIVRTVSPESYVYCRGSYTVPSSSDLAGSGGNPRVYVSTNSWGCCYGSYNTNARNFDNVAYDSLVAVFASAGNAGSPGDGRCADSSYRVRGLGSGLNVMTVGAYDDATMGIASFSCYADPTNTKNDKPDFSAPGVAIKAGGHTKSGTSMSTPHAAAFAANLMSASTYFQLKPHLLKAMMLASATDSISGGSDKVGLGGIDFYSAYYNYRYAWWSGGNGSFFDSNNEVNYYYYLPAGRTVRVALAWLNRGTYTYNNRTATHPIGMDLDLTVYSPTGSYVAGSASYDNPHEHVRFTAPASGTYRFKIRRYANRDTGSAVRMGLVIDW